MAGRLLELLESGKWQSQLLDQRFSSDYFQLDAPSEKEKLLSIIIIGVVIVGETGFPPLPEGLQVRSSSRWTAAFSGWREAAEFFPHKRPAWLPACLPACWTPLHR